MDYNSIKQLPKAELHCHLDGSVPIDALQKLYGNEIPTDKIQISDDCESLKQYLSCFDIPLVCLQTAEGLKAAGRELLKEAAKENMKYMEIRFAPLLSRHKGIKVREVMEAVLSGLEEGKKETGIQYQVIACAMRHHEEEANRYMMKEVREFLGNGVCAVDLAGDEAAYPMKEFQSLFQYAKELEFPFTIHAGECGSALNIKQAVELGAKRIGHGIAMKHDPEIIKLCKKNRIGIEMCPTSNFQTKAVKNKAEYPIRQFMNHNLGVTINTDNRTVSNTTMTDELYKVYTQYHLSEEEMRKLMRNAWEESWAPDTVKNEYLKFYT